MILAERCDLGRCRGVWVPEDQVLEHLACGWELLALAEAGDGAVLMAPGRGNNEQDVC